MLDINLFRTKKGFDPEKIRQSQLARNASVEIVDEIIELDKLYLQTLIDCEQAKKNINLIQREISAKIKAGLPYDDLLAKKSEYIAISKSDAQNILFNNIQAKLVLVGNIVHDSVVIGTDETFNPIVRVYSQPFVYDFPIKSHFEVMKSLDIIDMERGGSMAGHRGYFLKGYGVLLNQALINYAINFLHKKGYTLLQPSHFMHKNVMVETVQLSDYDETLYKLDDDKYLIATSEQPISAYHRGEMLAEGTLPIQYCGLSTCYRKEAGSHGKDLHGIFRVHQFEKIEQFCITKPEESWEMFEKMMALSEEFYQNLGLHYRVVNIVSGALNNAAAKKYDLEAWFPESNKFRELVSCSNCTDYQSISMGIRLKRAGAKTREFVHCLNSTLCATERTMCCLVENYQTEKGLAIPPVLQPYLGTDFIGFKTI